ncbi:MAG: glutamate--tRNA ligase, partial [Nitrososphaerales archaeon]
GFTKANTKPPFDVLESINRKMIDPSSIRLFFVTKPFLLQVKNAPPRKVKIKNHPDTDMGVREVSVGSTFYIGGDDVKKMKEGSEVRLIDLYNVKIDSVGDQVIGTYDSDEIRNIPKIQWVSQSDAVKMTVMVPRTLYIGEEYNPDSLEVVEGYAESYVSKLKPDDRVQFVRFGFCRIDSANVAILTHK